MDFNNIKTPSYVIDEAKLISNLKILSDVEKNTGCKILLAQKAFSCFAFYPLIGQYLSGTTASGLYEAKLGYEEMGKENHVFSPAYTKEEIIALSEICSHILFNSVAQYEIHKKNIGAMSPGLRINPEYSTQNDPIYDPCAPFSRLGITKKALGDRLPEGIEGLHFHTLCEQNSDALCETFKSFENNFGSFLYQIKWLNLGGGHHITRPDYDINALENLIIYIKNKYNCEVYLEPGEAVALNAGYLVCEVMDKVDNGMQILITDTSAACHMPDVLEMPYRPPLKNSGMPGEKKYTYRISSRTCLAGDIIGDYSFDSEINIGDRLIFEDAAIYSMVKNNTFNGMPLPSISVLRDNGNIELIKEFGYDEFKRRLS